MRLKVLEIIGRILIDRKYLIPRGIATVKRGNTNAVFKTKKKVNKDKQRFIT